ncbi:MAG: T9SS type A sorting domain-containing protein, partial [candidate division WOR-3 bacterium]
EDAIYVSGWCPGARRSRIYKLDKDGNPIWAVEAANHNTPLHPLALTLTLDGDLVVMFKADTPPSYPNDQGDLVFARLSSTDGSLVWLRAYNVTGMDDCLSPAKRVGLTLSDGTLLFSVPFYLGWWGEYPYTPSGIMYLAPQTGNIMGFVRIPNPNYHENRRWIRDMALAPDGDILSVWWVPDPDPETLLVTKASITWSFRWVSAIASPPIIPYYTHASGIAATPEGGCVMVGSRSEEQYKSYALISRFDSDGDPLWHKVLYHTPFSYDYLSSVKVGTGENIYVVGVFTLMPPYAHDDYVVTRLNPDGSTCISVDTVCPVETGSPIFFSNFVAQDVTNLYAPEFYITSVSPLISEPDEWVDTLICEPELDRDEMPAREAGDPQIFYSSGILHLYSPADFDISLCLYDVGGRLVQNLYSGSLGAGDHAFIPNMGTKGVYIVVLKYQSGAKTLKITR